MLLAILVILLLALAYATYYFIKNRTMPTIGQVPIGEEIVPPQYLYSISGRGANELQRPVGVAVAPNGRVYVVDYGRSRVSVFERNGRFRFAFSKTNDGSLVNPVHLGIRDDTVWVSDRRKRKLYRFSLDGKPLGAFRTKNEALRWTPLAFSWASDGALRATDVGQTQNHRVLYFSVEGSRTAQLGGTAQVVKFDEAPGKFLFPNGLAVAPNGDVYVSDGNNRRVQILTAAGRFKQFVNTSGVPRGIAIDKEKRLYVANALSHTIDVYDLKGRAMTSFGERGYGPGQFNYPNDVALDRAGRIYITDRDNNQVQVWGWPQAQLPPLPKAPVSYWWCLLPLLFLPLLLLLRKSRVVVTPDFVDELIAVGEIKAVADRRRLQLVAPEEDRALYEGKVAEDIALTDLLEFSEYSESDADSIKNKIRCTDREAMFLAMGARARALGNEDKHLHWLATVAEVRSLSVAEFREVFLDRDIRNSQSTD